MKITTDLTSNNYLLSVGLGAIGGILAGKEMPNTVILMNVTWDGMLLLLRICVTGALGGLGGAIMRDIYTKCKALYVVYKSKKRKP